MIQYIIVGILSALILFLWFKYQIVKKRFKEKCNELELLLNTSEKQLQFQQDFVSILSQELRTPLYGIMGLTNLLADEYPKLREDRKLKSLKFSGDYLLTLINNILQVNFINKEKINTENTIFNLENVTQNLVQSFSYATENSGNILHFNFDLNINYNVNGDPAILSQILMNLVSNALRFTKNGNVYFSVDLIKKKGNTATISFKITHDGYEVSKEDQKSIYQEFINVENEKKGYLGTGINSKIVNRLAKAVNAEIIIQNNSHVGSEYTFVIDFEISQIKEKQIHQSSAFEINSDSKFKALIVDDNKLNLLVADKILSKEQFDCTTIDNGFDAIDLARENIYDVILMDINMPKLNGIGTTKRIREFDLKTPIIALTAVDVTQLNRQIIQAGLNDYILKPYNKTHLLEMIHKHIENSVLS